MSYVRKVSAEIGGVARGLKLIEQARLLNRKRIALMADGAIARFEKRHHREVMALHTTRVSRKGRHRRAFQVRRSLANDGKRRLVRTQMAL